MGTWILGCSHSHILSKLTSRAVPASEFDRRRVLERTFIAQTSNGSIDCVGDLVRQSRNGPHWSWKRATEMVGHHPCGISNEPSSRADYPVELQMHCQTDACGRFTSDGIVPQNGRKLKGFSSRERWLTATSEFPPPTIRSRFLAKITNGC